MTAEAKAAPAIAPPGKGNGTDATVAPVVPPAQTCPHAGQVCLKIPVCALHLENSKSYCVDWIEEQRAIGRQRIERGGRIT